jgi:5,10-methylene-tetrahydrofolate dehydrogenase/methenyl tetrahydrofolate cyclohydrolase
MKKKACDEIGIMSHGVDFVSDVTQEELLRYCVLFAS